MALILRGLDGIIIPMSAGTPSNPPGVHGRIWTSEADASLHYMTDAGADYQLTPNLGSAYTNDQLGQAAPASRVPPAANGMHWVPIQVLGRSTLTGIRFRRGAGTTAGNVIAALYNSAGTRVAQSASTAIGTVASAVISCPFTSTYVAAHGLYWAGLLHSLATNAFMGWAVNDYLGPASYAAQGSFTAPATFTPPATSVLATATVIPWVATY